MATVTFDHVTKKYGDVIAVHDLNLEIADGEFMVLVGPSGCGKTTSLRMIAGLEEISSGTLRIGDRVVNDVPPKDRDIAMVFQSYALYPHMTVRDNLAFGLKLRKVPKADIERRVKEAAGTIQLSKLLDRKPKELSGGQRQRVALGRAIVREPAVFLMDEPLSNLDAKLRVQTRAEIARLHQRLKTTMVYVTHDQVEAMTMGTRIAVMSDGLLQQVGTPQALYDHPINRFVAGFIGSPSMNFIDGDDDRLGRLVPRCRGRRDQDPAAVPLPPGRRSDQRAQARRRDPAGAPRDRRGPKAAALRATADVVEYLGNEELIHVRAGGRDLVAIVSSEHRVKPGDVIDFRIPLDKLHLFDADSGLTLTSRGRGRRFVTIWGRGVQPGHRPAGTDAPTAGHSPGADTAAAGGDATAGRRRRPDRTSRRQEGPSPRPLPRIPRRHDRACRRIPLDPRDRGAPGCRGDRRHRRGGPRPARPPVPHRRRRGAAWRSRPARSTSTRSRARSRIGRRRGARARGGDGLPSWALAAPAGFWTAPGFATELMHLYLATELVPANEDRLGPDEDEHLQLERIPRQDAVTAAERGLDPDAKSIVGLLWLARFALPPPT